MLGNFSYCNPAKLYFGDQSLDYLNTELPKYGKNRLDLRRRFGLRLCQGGVRFGQLRGRSVGEIFRAL